MDIKARLIGYEGTKAYQTKLGYFRNGKYHVYKDTVNVDTIGFGHKVQQNDGCGRYFWKHEKVQR